MFADDLLLASISVTELQKMIDICKSEFDWLDMKVNVKKSLCIRIGRRFNVNLSNFSIDGNKIPWGAEMRYLGIWIKAATVFKCNFHASKLKFFRSLNGILGKVGSSSPPHLTLSLTSTFCNPILLYGLESLNINKYDTNRLSFPFDSVFKKLFSSFNKDVITLCQFYLGYLPLKFEIDKKNLAFL